MSAVSRLVFRLTRRSSPSGPAGEDRISPSHALPPNRQYSSVLTWVREDEYTFAREGKLCDFLDSANMMWSSTYSEHLRLTCDGVISPQLPRLRERLHGTAYPSPAGARAFTPIPL